MIARTEQEIIETRMPAEAPLVGVCCATFNHEPYIGEALDGFLMQETDFSFEIIVRDDCSTDDTATIVKAYAEKYPNVVRPIYETENQYLESAQKL